MGLDNDRHPNFGHDFLHALASAFSVERKTKGEIPLGISPEDILHFAYAVFYSLTYRTRYAEFLKIDFPRLPLTSSFDLFRVLAQLGGELVALHLLESPKLTKPVAEFVGGRNPEVEKISWSRNTVWIDKVQTTGFKGVREEVWNFHIGGYQVCEKWLKDRKGRQLSSDDIAHYQKVIVALSETIRLMTEVDNVIEAYGGWPGAFQDKPNGADTEARGKETASPETRQFSLTSQEPYQTEQYPEPAVRESAPRLAKREPNPLEKITEKQRQNLKRRANEVLKNRREVFFTVDERKTIRDTLGPNSINLSDPRLAEAFLHDSN